MRWIIIKIENEDGILFWLRVSWIQCKQNQLGLLSFFRVFSTYLAYKELRLLLFLRSNLSKFACRKGAFHRLLILHWTPPNGKHRPSIDRRIKKFIFIKNIVAIIRGNMACIISIRPHYFRRVGNIVPSSFQRV